MHKTSPLADAKNTARSRLRTATTAVATATGLALAQTVHAQGSDQVKIALIGCGGRGTGAAVNALSNASHKNVRLVAMADAFSGRLENSLRAITTRCPNQVDVPPERRFTALDAFQKAIDCEVDLVLLCTPPGFRPMQFEAAVEAGRHVFMEKPVAVDGPGVRRVLAANEKAKKKKLLVAVGHHLRHETKHREVIARIHDGAIGDVKYMRAYFNSGGVWVRRREADETEMQYQVKNWYYFTWLSGDHIVEQHVHDLDVMNWIADATPTRAVGMGGRQVRIGPDYGEIFDHHAIEFDYADGRKMYSFCRHIPRCWNSFSEHAHGTKGFVSIEGHGRSVLNIAGQEPVTLQRGPDGHQVEHDDLFAALIAGKPYNEGDYGATSTMTAIMGRMATYSGKEVRWNDAINSNLDLSPKTFTWDAEPLVKPDADGLYACAVPGVSKAW